MKRTPSLLLASLVATSAITATACSDADDSNPTTTPPKAPTLGALVDRVGRPGIAELLIAPFDPTTDHQAAVVSAFASADPTTWQSTARAPIAASLAIWDGLDGTCGNQALAAATVSATRYDALATLLADDRLWLDSRQTTCGQYLAVELGVTTDCGGRTPSMDVVDVSLSLVVNGTTSGLGDGVSSDADGAASATFPFLRVPSH